MASSLPALDDGFPEKRFLLFRLFLMRQKSWRRNRAPRRLICSNRICSPSLESRDSDLVLFFGSHMRSSAEGGLLPFGRSANRVDPRLGEEPVGCVHTMLRDGEPFESFKNLFTS